MSKTIVTYFSASGVTATAAKKLAEAVGGELYEIRPETHYTTADLDWRDKNSRSTKEMTNRALRPKIVTGDIDLAPYDTVYVGFPIWWGVAPTVVNTFLESQDLTGKTVVVFATSGGSGMGSTVAELKPSAPGAHFAGARLIRNESVEELRAWAKTL